MATMRRRQESSVQSWRGETLTSSDFEASLQSVKLGPEYGRELVAKLLEPLVDLRDLGLPLLDVDLEGSHYVLGAHVESVDVERAGRRHMPDGGIMPVVWWLDESTAMYDAMIGDAHEA